MKDRDAIQFAHDMLHALVAGELPLVECDPETLLAAHAAHDALGWVLSFPCGTAFDRSLARIERAIEAAGYVARKRPGPRAKRPPSRKARR